MVCLAGLVKLINSARCNILHYNDAPMSCCQALKIEKNPFIFNMRANHKNVSSPVHRVQSGQSLKVVNKSGSHQTENKNQSLFIRLYNTFILDVNPVKRNNIILLVLVIKSETWQNAEDHPIFTELRNEDVIKHFMKLTSCFTPRVWISKSQGTTCTMI